MYIKTCSRFHSIQYGHSSELQYRGFIVFKQWRSRLPQDSVFRKPLVFEITVILILKLVLLVVLWHLVFKPLKPQEKPDINQQILPSTLGETQYD